MLKHKSAVKRNLQNLKANERNRAQKAEMKTAIKKFRTLIEAGEKDKLDAEFVAVQKVISMSAQKGIIHKNTGARYISRLNTLKNKTL